MAAVIIEFLLEPLRALARFGPGLAVNVFLACFITGVITWAGCNIAALARLTSADAEHPFDVLLIGYTCGAFYSLILMYVLGGLAVFTTPALWAAVLLPAMLRGRDSLRFTSRIGRPGWKIVPFIVLCGGPLLISLTNPMPSWMDVLETSVAPVQRLITFDRFDPALALPSAVYPANRAFPLYTAFFGVSARLTGLEAFQILAASLVPTLILTLLAAYRLGSVLLPANRHAGWMAALAWVLTCHYLQLQSARSTVWQMTFTLVALTLAVELLRRPGNFRLMVRCAVVTAASVLAHPLEGLFTVIAVICLVLVAFTIDGFASPRQYVAATLIGVASGAPLLWSWFPEREMLLWTGILLITTIPAAVYWGKRRPGDAGQDGNQTRVPSKDRSTLFRWAPPLAVLSTLILKWNFYATSRRSFILQELMRYPLPTALALIAIILAVFRKSFTLTAVAGGVALISASLPLWILPHIELDPVTAASLSYEFALKATEYWLSGLLAVSGSTVLASIWARYEWKSASSFAARTLVITLLVVPVPTLLDIPVGEAHRSAGLYGMSKWQIRLAGEGYWGGWGNRRTIVGQEDRDLYEQLRSYVAQGRIGFDDRIAHIAGATTLQATPFPAFTGISQDLYLPNLDTASIHSGSEAQYDIDISRPTNEWVLIERSMLPRVSIDTSDIVFENDRVILTHSPRPR